MTNFTEKMLLVTSQVRPDVEELLTTPIAPVPPIVFPLLPVPTLTL